MTLRNVTIRAVQYIHIFPSYRKILIGWFKKRKYMMLKINKTGV